MRKRIMVLVATALTATMMAAGPVLAVGGPNEAGNSGHFHPKSNPCKSNPDHPRCPGPH